MNELSVKEAQAISGGLAAINNSSDFGNVLPQPTPIPEPIAPIEVFPELA